MTVDSKMPTGSWRTVRVFGTVTIAGGLLLSALPVLVTGRAAVAINSLIVAGPFLLIVGAFCHVAAVIGSRRAPRRR